LSSSRLSATVTPPDMQDHVRYLVIDDVPQWATAIGSAVRNYFECPNRCGFSRARVKESSAYDPKQADQQISVGGWESWRGRDDVEDQRARSPGRNRRRQ
jgi:hypothetical protein